MNPADHPATPPHPLAQAFVREQGTALLVTLIVMAVASMIGLYSINNATLETRLSSAYRNQARADNWATTGRSVALMKLYLRGGTPHPRNLGAADCKTNLFQYPSAANPKVEICIRAICPDPNNCGEISSGSSGGGVAGSGLATMTIMVYWYWVIARTRLETPSGKVIGHRAVEAVERVSVVEF